MTPCALCQQTGKMVTHGPDDATYFCLPCLRAWYQGFL
jgi:hypothetical protein